MLKNSMVVVFGVGGVGLFVVEVFVWLGVGCILFVDKDDVDIINVNCQFYVFFLIVGQLKVDLMKVWIVDINFECEVIVLKMFYMEEMYE